MRLLALQQLSGEQLDALAEVLHACVHGGASVGFMLPFSLDDARTYWRNLAPALARGERVLLAAETEGRLCGTVQLALAQPANQPHRADLAKLLVHPQARGRGVGARLVQAAETAARNAGKTLLVLDTASPEAERLYTRAGWVRCGRVPGYALLPHGGLCDTHFFYRVCGPALSGSAASEPVPGCAPTDP